MIKLYVKRILMGLMDVVSVPVKWREDVDQCFICADQIRHGELEMHEVAQRLRAAVQEILDYDEGAV